PQPGEPERIVLGIHGFNDHGGGFEPLARSLNAAGISVHAYDQRGFGATPTAGTWPGHAVLVADLKEVVRQLRQRHPETEIYLAGKSMGGGVALLAMASEEAPMVAGTILIAPAVWGRGTMGWHHRAGLWLGTRLAPGMELSADLAVELGVDPTDDPAVLEELRRDPLVQRQARIDTLDGLTELMSAALESAAQPIGPTLLLYGERDEIIPAEPICMLVEALHGADPDHLRVALYPEGFHMLTRYSRAADTHADIAAWVLSDPPPLPSGRETGPQEAAARLCR
ncbi:MAG: lysophospholipase, partial [Ectothiorhodospiraceae bacterium]|nr:lysophospholipase [Ectothiorhodospiraceae bacterium]